MSTVLLYVLNRIIVSEAFWEITLLLPIVKSIAGRIPSLLFSTVRDQEFTTVHNLLYFR